MPFAEGDNVELTVSFVTDDACWGTSGDAVGFVHHTGWSGQQPIPDSAVPREGQRLRVRVIRVVRPQEQLPPWTTFGGKYKIDFAAVVED